MATTLSYTMNLIPPKINLEDKDKRVRAAQRLAANKALLTATEAISNQIPFGLRRAQDTYKWPWGPGGPGNAGKGDPRVIRDTGALMENGTVKTSYMKTKAKITISYSSPYAALVYYGGVIQPYGNRNAAAVTLPGRPWILKAVDGSLGDGYDFQKQFYDRYEIELLRNLRVVLD